jgi:hypothetical protein
MLNSVDHAYPAPANVQKPVWTKPELKLMDLRETENGPPTVNSDGFGFFS